VARRAAPLIAAGARDEVVEEEGRLIVALIVNVQTVVGVFGRCDVRLLEGGRVGRDG
jgi:hypothetical protein